MMAKTFLRGAMNGTFIDVLIQETNFFSYIKLRPSYGPELTGWCRIKTCHTIQLIVKNYT